MTIYELLLCIDYVILLVGVLMNVAFITLLERKILGFSQLRLGPNKPSLAGLLQPMADAIKLFTKSFNSTFSSLKLFYYLGPVLGLLLMLVIWQVHAVMNLGSFYKFSFIVLMVILSLNIYPVLMSGWACNSKYAILGSLRGVAQTISYEISLALILMIIVIFGGGLSLLSILEFGDYLNTGVLCPWVLGIWLLSGLAETNRTPFDFAEGESELVSGFNIEYGAGGFALIFMAEYGMIYFMSAVTVCMFFPGISLVFFVLMTSFFISFWIWARTTFPRYRYDMLMSLAWKSVLPFSLFLVICSVLFMI